MNTKELLGLFKDHGEKSLLFEYKTGDFVGANYHITEVKNTTIDAVDCGGRTDFWKETIIQLWESPSEIGKTEFMTVSKALSILERVNGMKPMVESAEVKFEYSNDGFHTAQLYVGGFTATDTSLVLHLAVEKTDCKAKEDCGVPAEKQEVAACCPPNTGCC